MESERGLSDVFVPQATVLDSTISGCKSLDIKVGDICTAIVVENDFGSCKWKAIRIIQKTTNCKSNSMSMNPNAKTAKGHEPSVQSSCFSISPLPMAFALYSKPLLLQSLLAGVYDKCTIRNRLLPEINMPLQEALRKLAKFKPGATGELDETRKSFLTALFNLRNIGDGTAFDLKLSGPWQLMELARGKIIELTSSIIRETVLLDMSVHPQESRYAVSRFIQLSLRDLRKAFSEDADSDDLEGRDAEGGSQDSGEETEAELRGFLIRQQYPLYSPARDDGTLTLEIIALDSSTIHSVAAKLREIFASTECLRCPLSERSAAMLDSKLQKGSQEAFLNQFHQSTLCCLTFDRHQRAAFLAGREENLAPAEAELAAQSGPEGALRRTAAIPVTDPRKRPVVLAKAGRVPAPPGCRALLRADGSAVDLAAPAAGLERARADVEAWLDALLR
jgi:hypothetical protein